MLHFTPLKVNNQTLMHRFVFQNTPPEKMEKISSQSPDINNLEVYNEVGEDTRNALNKLAKEFHPDKLSPLLMEIQQILLSLKEGEAKKLPIEGATVYAIRDKGELIILNGEKISSIADWLEKRKNPQPNSNGQMESPIS